MSDVITQYEIPIPPEPRSIPVDPGSKQVHIINFERYPLDITVGSKITGMEYRCGMLYIWAASRTLTIPKTEVRIIGVFRTDHSEYIDRHVPIPSPTEECRWLSSLRFDDKVILHVCEVIDQNRRWWHNNLWP